MPNPRARTPRERKYAHMSTSTQSHRKRAEVPSQTHVTNTADTPTTTSATTRTPIFTPKTHVPSRSSCAAETSTPALLPRGGEGPEVGCGARYGRGGLGEREVESWRNREGRREGEEVGREGGQRRTRAEGSRDREARRGVEGELGGKG